MTTPESSDKPYPKIVVTPPGPRAREVIRSDALVLSPSTCHFYPLVLETADGCIVRDMDGNEYIDLCSASGVMNIGYNHPQVLEAIKAQLGKTTHYGYGTAYYESIVQLSKALSDITPGEWEKRVCYGNSGSEAIEAAMKVAAWHTRNQAFLAFVGSSHGRTIGAMSLSCASPVHRRHFPTLARVLHIPFPYCYRCPLMQTHPECEYRCVDMIENYLKTVVSPEEVAALVIEPIQGEGCIVPPEGFFERLVKITKEHDFLLIDDEVLTGLGRTGRWFAIENWDIAPDILCVGGSLSSGIPIGATVTKADVMDWEPDSHASTTGGNPLACMAALATVEIIYKEHLMENAAKQGSYLLRRLSEFAAKHPIIGDIRGRGLIIGMEIVKDSSTKEPYPTGGEQVILKSWRHGVLLQMVGTSTVRLCPPLSISQDLIDASLEVLGTAISEVATRA